MSTDFQQIQTIFLAALGRPPEQWEAYLAESCAGDPGLREKVELLLRAHAEGSGILDRAVCPGSPAVEQPLIEEPGAQIGPYKLLQQIGEGGMGVVYMAEQSEPVERRVALKIIKPGMDTRQVIARFEAERHALAMMDHPNIARVLDAGTTGKGEPGQPLPSPSGRGDGGEGALASCGRPYFVMELVKGVPITQYCDEHQLTPRQRLELFVPVCHAVQHAHQKGIIHRDIKPTNVLVAEYDDRPVPKIIDFGVAKAIQQGLAERSVFTQLGQVVGTIDHMSPEQAKLNELDVDTRSDVYSLGVLLYELLTGETPFDGERLRAAAFDEILRIIREEDPPRPSTRLSSSQSLPSIAANRQVEPKKLSTLVRGELDWIVMKALEKDRARRYATANAFAADIQHYLADEPVVACPPSASYRFRKFARRNKAALSTLAIVGVVLMLAAVVSTWQAVRATRAEAEARHRADEATAARAEANRAAADAQAVADFLVNDLLGSAAPEKTLGREVTVKEVLANAEKTIDTAFKDQPLREAAVRDTMATAYRKLGLYEAAERHARRAVELHTALLGPEHPDMLVSMSNLARALDGQGKPEEAHRLHEETLGIQKRVVGPEHPTTLRSMNSVATGLRSQGKLDEARELFNETLALQKRVLGPEHRDTLNTMHDLAHVEKPQQAAKLHEELLAIQTRVLGPEHPDTLRSMYCLAGDLVEQERLEEGQKLLEETVAIEKRVLGPEHPHTLKSMDNLACTFRRQGRLDEARKLHEDTLATRKRVIGPERPDTLKSMHNLACTLGRQGKHDEARRMFEEILAIQNRVLGPEHADTLRSMRNLACVLRELGKFDEARKLHEETLAVRKRVLGAEHPDTLDSMNGLATVLQDLGRFDEALKLHEEVLAIQTRAKPWRPDTCLTQNLMHDLCRLGKHDEALKHYEEALAVVKRHLSPEDPAITQSALRLAELGAMLGSEYWNLDRRSSAHRLWQGVLADLHKIAVENSEDQAIQERVASCEREICQRYGAMGLWDLAAMVARHNAALGRVTDYTLDADFAVLLAALGEEDAWREYCRLLMPQTGEESPGYPPKAPQIRTILLFTPAVIDPDECVVMARKELESNPRRYYHHFCLALAQYRASQYEEGLKTIESNPVNASWESISEQGSKPACAYLYALAAQGDGRMEDALAQLGRAESLCQNTCKSQLAEDGKELTEPFCRWFWDLAAAQVLRREAWQKIQGQSPPAAPWWHLIQARGYGLLGESERAEQESAAAVAADDPEIWLVWATRARLREQVGDIPRAEADWNRALELAPLELPDDDPLPWTERACLCARLGRYDEAARDFIRANELLRSPLRWDATSALFDSLMQHQEVFARIAELRPDDLALWGQRGHYHALRGQWKQALPAYARASAGRRPNTPYAHVLLLAGDEEGYRGVCGREAAQFGQTDQPDTARHLVLICSAGPQSGIDPARILGWAQLAVRAGRNKFTLAALAWAHYRGGQFDQTVRVLQEAMELPEAMPTSSAAFPLALAYHGLGQEEEGRKWYQIGVAALKNTTPRNPDNPASWEISHWLHVNVWYREAKAVLEPDQPQTPESFEPAVVENREGQESEEP